MSLATRSAKQRKEKQDTDSAKQTRQKTHGAAPKQNVDTRKESKETVKESRKTNKASESTAEQVLRQNSDLLMEEEKQQIEIQKLQEENTKLKQSNEEYKNLKEELQKTKDLLAQKESEITHLKEDIHNLRKRGSSHASVSSAMETKDITLELPDKIKCQSSLSPNCEQTEDIAKTYTETKMGHNLQDHKAHEDHGHNSANLPPASKTTVISVNFKTDFQNETKSTGDTERSDNRNKLNESGNDPRHSQVEKGDDEDKEEGTRIFKAEVCTENFHEVPTIEDKDKHKIEDIEVPVQERTEEKNSLLSRPSLERKGDNDGEEEINRILKAEPCTENVQKDASTEDKYKQKTEAVEVPVQGLTDEKTTLLNRPSQVKKEEHEEEDGEDRKRILNEESCTKTLHQEAGTDEKYKHKIEELEALVKQLTNEKNQLSNRPSQVKTKKEEERKQNLKAEPRGGYPHEQAGTEGKYRQKIEQLEVCVKELTTEKNTLLNRLSEIGAMKMTDNNPTVTDLSDDNRPEMLVEQFSELYDNEWTDAYVHLTKAGKTMELSVKLLLQILKDAYDICLSSATKKATTLRMALLSYAGLSDEDSSELELQKIEKKLSEYRTKKSQCNIACVEEVTCIRQV